MSLHYLAGIAATTLALSAPASALTLELDFGSLPSAQGWSFENNTGLPESAISAVNGTTLTYNTIGTGFGGYAFYAVPNVLDLTKSYSLQVTARVLAEEGSSIGALGFLATGADWGSGISIGKGIFTSTDAVGAPFVPIDNSVFHSYRMDVQPDGTYALSVDGTLAQSGAIRTADTLPNLVYFGDVGSGISANVEISRLSFQQPIPEPSTLALSGLGIALVVLTSRQRRRVNTVTQPPRSNS